MRKILLVFFVLFAFNIKASAASSCSYEEQTNLNSKAANIKVSYEVTEEILEFADMDVPIDIFEISILNLTDDFYIVVKNNITDDETTYRSSDAVDGIIKFKWDKLEDVTNFTFQVYTSDNASCPDEKYKTIYLTTPRYNPYYDRESCQNLEDFYLCEKFVTFDQIEEDEFLNKLESYRNEEKTENKPEENNQTETPKNITDSIFEFLDTYKWYIVGGLGLILIILLIISKNKQKKQRDLGL